MENKKLLKFLFRDLSELEELVSEKGKKSFDDLEMEFLHTRISGAKRMIQILSERENAVNVVEVKQPEKEKSVPRIEEKGKKVNIDSTPAENKGEIKKEEKQEESEEEPHKEVSSVVKEEPVEKNVEKTVVLKQEVKEKELVVKTETKSVKEKEEDVDLGEEEAEPDGAQRLGDKFSKERSINDLIEVGNSKLEHKLSNRPVDSIKTAIGINDRFQYIRELFEGNAEAFSKTVAEIDKLNDIKEAVEYLQMNFKWKKNETSLKFVNLVKRRFSND